MKQKKRFKFEKFNVRFRFF